MQRDPRAWLPSQVLPRMWRCIGPHHSSKGIHPPSKSHGGYAAQIARNAEFHQSAVVRNLGQQIANSIHEMKTGRYPLVWPGTPIDDGPDEVCRIIFNDHQILTERFEPMSAPNIEVRRRVSEWSKEFVKNRFVKNRKVAHLIVPMRRQCLVPSHNSCNF